MPTGTVLCVFISECMHVFVLTVPVLSKPGFEACRYQYQFCINAAAAIDADNALQMDAV